MRNTDFDVIWHGARIGTEYGFTEPGELIPRELRQECSPLARMISPVELDAIEARELGIVPVPNHHHKPEGA